VKGKTVSLQEWQTLRPEPGGPLAGFGLDDTASRDLAEKLSAAGQIEILELSRGLELRATSFVGRFQLGDLTVTIQPKLPGAPLINLLRYAYGLRNLHLFEPSAYAMQKWTFQDLLVQQLAAEASELLARGIHRDYQRRPEELTQPRGRIDFDLVARTRHLARATLPCVHHPRTEDNALNQLLLAGLVHAVKSTSDPELRAHVRRLCQQLSKGVTSKPLTGRLLSDARLQMDRRTRTYASAMELIEILMKGEGVSLSDETVGVRLPGFLFDMNRFFQELISRFLSDHLDGFEVIDEFSMRGFFAYDPTRNPMGRRAPSQRPDFVIRRKQKILAVLDAKYRDLWERNLPREMLYQLALYAVGFRETEHRAVIVYPTLNTSAKDQAILIREPFAGVVQAEVILRPVNLLVLEEKLRDQSAAGRKAREDMARGLAFGGETTFMASVHYGQRAAECRRNFGFMDTPGTIRCRL
jgi:5-methylcytosine-specific restriction enzyme subunit McrC